MNVTLTVVVAILIQSAVSLANIFAQINALDNKFIDYEIILLRILNEVYINTTFYRHILL